MAMTAKIFIIPIIMSALIMVQVNNAMHISVYYETLCPDSRRFIVEQLLPAYEKFGFLIDIEMIPFGNVEEYHDDKGVLRYQCQHGAPECIGNKFHTCVIAEYFNKMEGREKAFKFFNCMFMHDNWKNTEAAADDCGNTYLRNKWQKIKTCISDNRGRGLYRMMGRKTRELNPSPNYIPWLVIDRKFDSTIQDGALYNLEKYICDNLNPQPPQCNAV